MTPLGGMVDLMVFYTYLYLRENGTPYYVGKGTHHRVFMSHRRIPTPPKERIICTPHPSETEAFEAEIFLISYFGREDLGEGALLNLTDGGDGASGFHHSTTTRRKIGEASRKRPRSAETRARQSSTQKGRPRGPWSAARRAAYDTRWSTC